MPTIRLARQPPSRPLAKRSPAVANKMMWVNVRGKDKLWIFEFMGDPKHIEEWRADGLEVWPLCNTYPKWVVDAGLRPVWAFFQDILGFKNPWSKK